MAQFETVADVIAWMRADTAINDWRIESWANSLDAAHTREKALRDASKVNRQWALDEQRNSVRWSQHAAYLRAELVAIRTGLHLVYNKVPDLPITPETCEAATDALHSLCWCAGLYGFGDESEIQPRSFMDADGPCDAAIAQEGGS